jgi:hypothetical protein
MLEIRIAPQRKQCGAFLELKTKTMENDIKILIAFQQYLHMKGLIDNKDWNWEKQAKKFRKYMLKFQDKKGEIEETVCFQ